MTYSLPSWIIPSCCALCGGDADAAICTPCRAQFFDRQLARCRCCGLPVIVPMIAPVCGDCLAAPPAFDATIVATNYLPPVDQLVLALKFGSTLALAPLFADMLARALRATLPPSDWPAMLAPVPLGRQRVIERGFNQALEIARPLARSLTLPLSPRLVARVLETSAQAGLQARQRHQNIRGAFVVPGLNKVAGQHVGIVDDVMTTGATLQELAATLKRFGATRVTNLVFARTLPA